MAAIFIKCIQYLNIGATYKTQNGGNIHVCDAEDSIKTIFKICGSLIMAAILYFQNGRHFKSILPYS